MRTISFLAASAPLVASAHPGPPHVHGSGAFWFICALGVVAATMRWASRRWTL